MNNTEIAQAARLDTLDLLYGVLFRPATTFGKGERPHTLPLGVAVLTLISVVMGLLHASSLESLGWVIGMIWCWLLLVWCLSSGILYLLTRGVSEDGSLADLMGATALSLLPWCLLAPLHVVGTRGDAWQSVAAIGTLIVWVWWMRILHRAIAGSLGISSQSAILAVLGSVALLLALPALLATVGALTLVIAAL